MDLLAELRGLFNAPNLSEQQALERVRTLSASMATTGDLATANQTIATLKQQVGDLQSRVPKALDEEVRAERLLRVGGLAEAMVGTFTPADVATIKKAVVGEEGKYDEVMLSRAPGAADCRAAALFTALRACKPAPATGHDAAFAQKRQEQAQGGKTEPDRQAELLAEQLKGYGIAPKN